MRNRRWEARGAVAVLAAALLACGGRGGEEDRISVPYPEDDVIDAAAIETGRRDTTWRAAAERDRRSRRGGAAGRTSDAASARVAPGDTAPVETFYDITPGRVNAPARIPLRSDAGPAIMRVQVLLDRAGFSPGVIDGLWGRNTEAALYWFQEASDLPATGEPDRRTLELLEKRTGDRAAVGRYRLTGQDLEGPFVAVPSNVYAQAKLDCLCYRSAAEMLAERFHTTEDVLQHLNPEVDLSALRAGAELFVPSVGVEQRAEDRAASIARILVSREGRYLHALDEGGALLFHFPTTVGAQYSPSPRGDFEVTRIVLHPPFHYQPNLLPYVPSDEPSTLLPPGPNSPVGVVWMQLSRPHYGIHGTASPSTIGYASSAGCVRLTNWDAVFLSQRVREGTPVEFPS